MEMDDQRAGSSRSQWSLGDNGGDEKKKNERQKRGKIIGDRGSEKENIFMALNSGMLVSRC